MNAALAGMYDMLGVLTNLPRTPSRVPLRVGADRTRVNPAAPDVLLWAGQQGATGWWEFKCEIYLPFPHCPGR